MPLTMIKDLSAMSPRMKRVTAWAMKKKGFYYGTPGMDLPILFRMKPDPKNRCWKGWEAVRVTVTIHG